MSSVIINQSESKKNKTHNKTLKNSENCIRKQVHMAVQCHCWLMCISNYLKKEISLNHRVRVKKRHKNSFVLIASDDISRFWNWYDNYKRTHTHTHTHDHIRIAHTKNALYGQKKLKGRRRHENDVINIIESSSIAIVGDIDWYFWNCLHIVDRIVFVHKRSIESYRHVEWWGRKKSTC